MSLFPLEGVDNNWVSQISYLTTRRRADYCVHETILKLGPWALVGCVNRSDLQISRHGFRMQVFKPEQKKKNRMPATQLST